MSQVNKSGLEGSCKTCCKKKAKLYIEKEGIKAKTSLYQKEYRKTNKESKAKHSRKYRENNICKIKSHQAVKRALYSTLLVKSNVCEYCCTTSKTEAHHTSYTEHMWLNIIWLCKECHLKADKDLI